MLGVHSNDLLSKLVTIKNSTSQYFASKASDELTDSGKDPNFPNSEEIDPPETNSNKIFKVPSSLTVPKYLWGTTNKIEKKKEGHNSNS